MSYNTYDPQDLIEKNKWIRKILNSSITSTSGPTQYYKYYAPFPKPVDTCSNIDPSQPVDFKEEIIKVDREKMIEETIRLKQSIDRKDFIDNIPITENSFDKIDKYMREMRGRLEDIKEDILKSDEPAIKDEEFTFDPEDLDI